MRLDPKENGLRKILNFGHTAGHAIEAAGLKTSHPLLHGEAIWLGMMVEALISFQTGLLPQTDFTAINNILAGQVSSFPRVKLDKAKILKAIASDKKSQKGSIQWTLLRCIGQAVYNQKVTKTLANQALTRVLSYYKFI